MAEPTYINPRTGKPITPLTPEAQLGWTGGQVLGMGTSAEAIASLLPASEESPWRTSDGDLVIQINGKGIVVKNIVEYINAHPEDTASVSDPRSVTQMDYAVNLARNVQSPIRSISDPTMPWGKLASVSGGIPVSGGYGQPATGYGATESWYPPVRWGTPIEEATEYARPEYESAYYKALKTAKPTVSPARYDWMESLRPELLRQWQATQPVSEAEFTRKPYTVEYGVSPVTSEEMAARVKELSKTMTLEAAEEQGRASKKGFNC